MGVGERDVRIANVHLSPFLVQRGSSISQAIAAIGKIETIHKEEIGRICKLVDPARPTLVVGDFNSLSTLAAPAQLTHVGMTDSYAAVHEDADAKFTWHWKLRVSELRFRIDYIFHSSHFKTLGSRILPSKGSDHYLLVSDLRMRNSEKTAP